MVCAQFDGGEAPHPMTGGSVLSGTQGAVQVTSIRARTLPVLWGLCRVAGPGGCWLGAVRGSQGHLHPLGQWLWCGPGGKGGREPECGEPAVSLESWNRSTLTGIYRCHACSCQEISRVQTAGQVARSRSPSRSCLARCPHGFRLVASVRAATARSSVNRPAGFRYCCHVRPGAPPSGGHAAARHFAAGRS
jgi:hypothetical protein